MALSIFVLGTLLLIVSIVLPHEKSRIVEQWIVNVLRSARSKEKYRVDLPSITEFHWRCKVQLQKVPFVLNERNAIILRAYPWHGDPRRARIELPISSSHELQEVSVRAISTECEFHKCDSHFALFLGNPTEGRFEVTPTSAGHGKIRFEFWSGQVLRGWVEKSVTIKSRQYGVILSARTTTLLRVTGIILAGVGGLLGILEFFR